MGVKMARKRRKGEGVIYFGNPCKYGHDGMRYTAGGTCVECTRARVTRQRSNKKSWETAALIRDMRPPKPTNPVLGNGWPYPDRFEDTNETVPGEVYVRDVRRVPFSYAA